MHSLISFVRIIYQYLNQRIHFYKCACWGGRWLLLCFSSHCLAPCWALTGSSVKKVGLCLSATGTKCITVAFIHRMTGETIYILCGAKQQDKVTASHQYTDRRSEGDHECLGVLEQYANSQSVRGKQCQWTQRQVRVKY